MDLLSINTDEVSFESLNFSFCIIDSIFFWWDKLIVDGFMDKKLFDGFWCFIVQDAILWVSLLVFKHVADGLKGALVGYVQCLDLKIL